MNYKKCGRILDERRQCRVMLFINYLVDDTTVTIVFDVNKN